MSQVTWKEKATLGAKANVTASPKLRTNGMCKGDINEVNVRSANMRRWTGKDVRGPGYEQNDALKWVGKCTKGQYR